MLSDIVDDAVRRMAKQRWMPPTLEIADLRQEAWVAVLEAQNEGVIDPVELQRRAELRIKQVMRAEANQSTIPVDWDEEDPED